MEGEQRERVVHLVELPQAEKDEISLYELWQILFKQRWIILSVTLAVFSVAVLYTVFSPDKFHLVTTVAVGQRIDQSGAATPIESIATLHAKLNTTYVPLVRGSYQERKIPATQVSVEIPKDSDVVILKSQGTLAVLENARSMHEEIIAMVSKDHNEQLAVERKELELNITATEDRLRRAEQERELAIQIKALQKHLLSQQQALAYWQDDALYIEKRKPLENQLLANQQDQASLREQTSLLKSRIERLQIEQKLLTKEISDTKQYIGAALDNRGQAAAQAGNSEDKAMMMLLIDGDIQRNRQQLSELERKLEIQLPANEANFKKSLEDLARQQLRVAADSEVIKAKLATLDKERELTIQQLETDIARTNAEILTAEANYDKQVVEQQQRLDELNFRLEKFASTRMLAPPVRSPEPVSPNRFLSLVLGLILGCFMGVLIGLVRYFMMHADQSKTVVATEGASEPEREPQRIGNRSEPVFAGRILGSNR